MEDPRFIQRIKRQRGTFHSPHRFQIHERIASSKIEPNRLEKSDVDSTAVLRTILRTQQKHRPEITIHVNNLVMLDAHGNGTKISNLKDMLLPIIAADNLRILPGDQSEVQIVARIECLKDGQ